MTGALILAMPNVMVQSEMLMRLKVKIISDSFSFAKPAVSSQI